MPPAFSFGTGTEAVNRSNLYGRKVNATLNLGPSISRATITPDTDHGRVPHGTVMGA